jgi:hypothetical protein
MGKSEWMSANSPMPVAIVSRRLREDKATPALAGATAQTQAGWLVKLTATSATMRQPGSNAYAPVQAGNLVKCWPATAPARRMA